MIATVADAIAAVALAVSGIVGLVAWWLRAEGPAASRRRARSAWEKADAAYKRVLKEFRDELNKEKPDQKRLDALRGDVHRARRLRDEARDEYDAVRLGR